MLLLVDNGSVFTKNIVEFLESTNTAHQAIPFDKVNPDDLDKFDSIILSGRRHNDHAMNALNSKLVNHGILQKKPLLGICYGAEILALTVGGTIRKMSSVQKGPDIVQVMQKILYVMGSYRCTKATAMRYPRWANPWFISAAPTLANTKSSNTKIITSMVHNSIQK